MTRRSKSCSRSRRSTAWSPCSLRRSTKKQSKSILENYINNFSCLLLIKPQVSTTHHKILHQFGHVCVRVAVEQTLNAHSIDPNLKVNLRLTPSIMPPIPLPLQPLIFSNAFCLIVKNFWRRVVRIGEVSPWLWLDKEKSSRKKIKKCT